MGVRETCWVIYLAGLPFSNFLYRSLDLWHGHAIWAEIGVVLMTALTFWFPTPARPINRPFGVWIAVVGVLTVGLWYYIASTMKGYPIAILMPLGHLFCAVLFVWSAYQSWTLTTIPKLLRWIGYAGMVSLVYGLIQIANLDQFFTPISVNIPRDVLQGTIGNYNHFAAYLAMLLPIWYLHPTKLKYGLIGVTLGLLCLTRSEAGLLAGGIVVLWEAWNRRRTMFYMLVVLFLFFSMYRFAFYDGSVKASLSHRLERWELYWPMAREKFITGNGIGYVFEYAKGIDQTNNTDHPLWHWRHTHNEYLQILVEQGIFGFLAFGWLVVDVGKSAWKLRQNPEVRCCAGMLLALFANALFNFPFHLWMLSSLGLMAYCAIKVIEVETCPS